MKLTLKYNKRISEVFNQKTWDIYESYPNGVETYVNRWLVELSEGHYSLAYGAMGKTMYCETQPTKELALEYLLALNVAAALDGKRLDRLTNPKLRIPQKED